MDSFKVHILGCGSALPTLRHYPSSQIVEVHDKLFMVDCGEGVQMQLRRCRVRFNKIGHVFISHLHGDHCFGLIGMISTFGLLGRNAKLHIYAEERLGDILRSQMDFFCSDLGYEVVFHPIDASRHDIIYEDRTLTVETIPLYHRLPTCGFLFREKPSLPHICREKVDFYGIPVSQIMNIKKGANWILEDGTVIPNEQLVTQAASPRCYAYCSDTRYMPDLHKQLKGVTTLYHESTYGEDNLQMAQKYNHSTARQAAMVARDAGVKQLVLGHYSSRYEDENVLLNEAKNLFENVCLANELDVIDV